MAKCSRLIFIVAFQDYLFLFGVLFILLNLSIVPAHLLHAKRFRKSFLPVYYCFLAACVIESLIFICVGTLALEVESVSSFLKTSVLMNTLSLLWIASSFVMAVMMIAKPDHRAIVL